MPIPTQPPYAFARLFAIERQRLLDLLHGLGPADWHRPTPCPAWDVLGLTVHLLGDDLSLLSWQRDHHHGTLPPDGLDDAGFIAWLDELQVEWVYAARRLSPAIAIELLDWAGTRVVDLVAAQDPTAVTAHVSWASSEPVPVWLDHARELSERWIHRQQLLEALEQTSDLRPDLGGPVLDTLRWAYPHRLAGHDAPDGTVVEITIAGGELGRDWRLVRSGERWLFDPSAPGRPVATLRMAAEQAWRLLTNNLSDNLTNSRIIEVINDLTNDHVEPVHGTPTTSGDPAIVLTLLRTRGIIGSPD